MYRLILIFISVAVLADPARVFATQPEGPESSGNSQDDKETISLTLDDAIRKALENSQQIRDARFESQISEAARREAQTGYLPRVTIEGSYQNYVDLPVIFLPPDSPLGDRLETGTDHNFDVSAQLSMPIYNQSVIRGVSLAKANEAMSEVMMEATRQEMKEEVQQAWLNVKLAEESLKALRISKERRQTDLELVKSMVEEQVAPEYDEIRTRVQLENLKPEVRQAENAFTGAVNYLKLLTAIPVDQDISLEGTLEKLYSEKGASGQDQLLTQDFSSNPDLMQQDARLEVAEAQLSLDRAAYVPSLSLIGSHTQQAQGNTFEPFDYDWVSTTFVGVNLSIPLFSGFERRFQRQQSQLQLEQQESQREFLEESVQVDYQNALDEMRQAGAAIEAQEANVEMAERGYEIARVGYESGSHTLIEVNDAELATTEARLNYLQSLFDYMNATLELERILGVHATD